MGTVTARWLSIFASVGAVCSPADGRAQAPDFFSGVYAGAEIGPVSYNTQIDFDGVNDPAGRGGFGYAALVGYDRVLDGWLVGAEVRVSGASVPGPYTFDPAMTGFAEMDLRREGGVGLELRAGRVIVDRVLIHGGVGYSVAKQSVRLDGVPLSSLQGGSEDVTFGTGHLGAGVEVGVGSSLALRFAFRALGGHDLSAADFGSVITSNPLTFLDVEPSQHQFMFGFRVGL